MDRQGTPGRLLRDTTLYNELVSLSRELNETLAREREPYFRPRVSELRALVQRYHPEALKDGFETGTLVGFVFDARDSVIHHVAVSFIGNERFSTDEKIPELFPQLRDVPPSRFGSSGIARLTPPGENRPVIVVWAAMRGGRGQ